MFSENAVHLTTQATTGSPQDQQPGVQKVDESKLFRLIKDISGYGDIKEKDIQYVLEELGLI